VTYFSVVYLKEIFVLTSLKWPDNSVETYRRFIKDCTHKLQNNVFDGVKWLTSSQCTE